MAPLIYFAPKLIYNIYVKRTSGAIHVSRSLLKFLNNVEYSTIIPIDSDVT